MGRKTKKIGQEITCNLTICTLNRHQFAHTQDYLEIVHATLGTCTYYIQNPTHLRLVPLLRRRLPHAEPRGRRLALLLLLLRHPVHDFAQHRPRRGRRRPLHRGRLPPLLDGVVEPRVLVLVVVEHLRYAGRHPRSLDSVGTGDFLFERGTPLLLVGLPGD